LSFFSFCVGIQYFTFKVCNSNSHWSGFKQGPGKGEKDNHFAEFDHQTDKFVLAIFIGDEPGTLKNNSSQCFAKLEKRIISNLAHAQAI